MTTRAKANYTYIKLRDDGSMRFANGGLVGYRERKPGVYLYGLGGVGKSICAAPEIYCCHVI